MRPWGGMVEPVAAEDDGTAEVNFFGGQAFDLGGPPFHSSLGHWGTDNGPTKLGNSGGVTCLEASGTFGRAVPWAMDRRNRGLHGGGCHEQVPAPTKLRPPKAPKHARQVLSAAARCASWQRGMYRPTRLYVHKIAPAPAPAGRCPFAASVCCCSVRLAASCQLPAANAVFGHCLSIEALPRDWPDNGTNGIMTKHQVANNYSPTHHQFLQLPILQVPFVMLSSQTSMHGSPLTPATCPDRVAGAYFPSLPQEEPPRAQAPTYRRATSELTTGSLLLTARHIATPGVAVSPIRPGAGRRGRRCCRHVSTRHGLQQMTALK